MKKAGPNPDSSWAAQAVIGQKIGRRGGLRRRAKVASRAGKKANRDQ
jgi:hypothetical protein